MANPEAFQKNIEAVAHWIAGGADPARVAAMADRIAAMAGDDEPGQACEREHQPGGGGGDHTGSDGQIFVYSAGTKGVLAVIAPKGDHAGLVHLEARQAAKDIGELLEKRSPTAGDARSATPSG